MSLESARAFVNKVKTVEAFAQKVHACNSAAELTQVAREEGFDVTLDEIQDCGATLTDTDLDLVVGGGVIDQCTSPMYKGYIDNFCRAGRPNFPMN